MRFELMLPYQIKEAITKNTPSFTPHRGDGISR